MAKKRKGEMAKRVCVIEALAAAYKLDIRQALALNFVSASLVFLRTLAASKKKSIEELNEVDVAAQLAKDHTPGECRYDEKQE